MDSIKSGGIITGLSSISSGEATRVIQDTLPKEVALPRDRVSVSSVASSPSDIKTVEATASGKEETVPDPAKTDKFTPIIDDDAFFNDVYKEVQNAKKSIYFETYLLNGKDGRALCELLTKKKQEGVDVKVLLDPSYQKLENWMNSNDPLFQMGKYLNENGVTSVNYPIGKLKGSLTPSEHAKLLVIDDKIAYIGGSNIDDTMNHDINVKIEGPSAKEIRQFFDESWAVATNPDPEVTGFLSDPVISNPKIQITTTNPTRSTIKPEILKNLKEAKESIYIEMFTLTDDDIEEEIINAKKRGVDVKVILCDNKEIFHVPTFHIPNISAAVKFYKAGVPTRWYFNEKFTQMHSKLCVFDHKRVMVGSANFIHNAFKGIHEYYGIIDDEELAKKMEAQFHKDWNENAKDIEKPTFFQRILAGAVELVDGIIF